MREQQNPICWLNMKTLILMNIVLDWLSLWLKIFRCRFGKLNLIFVVANALTSMRNNGFRIILE